jgi:hypothetical protein
VTCPIVSRVHRQDTSLVCVPSQVAEHSLYGEASQRQVPRPISRDQDYSDSSFVQLSRLRTSCTSSCSDFISRVDFLCRCHRRLCSDHQHRDSLCVRPNDSGRDDQKAQSRPHYGVRSGCTEESEKTSYFHTLTELSRLEIVSWRSKSRLRVLVVVAKL